MHITLQTGRRTEETEISGVGGEGVTAREFRSYGLPLEIVTSFRYLGQMISVADNNWPVVVRNLSRARAVWRRMARILNRKGAAPRMSGLFFRPWYRQCCSLYRRPVW